jgi:hypothetical protein
MSAAREIYIMTGDLKMLDEYMANYEPPQDDIFVWDGKGSIVILNNHGHVHLTGGSCIKNRYAPRCN